MRRCPASEVFAFEPGSVIITHSELSIGDNSIDPRDTRLPVGIERTPRLNFVKLFADVWRIVLQSLLTSSEYQRNANHERTNMVIQTTY